MSWVSTETAILLYLLVNSSNGHPIGPSDVTTDPRTNVVLTAVVATAFLVSSIFLLLLCSCCRDRRDGFKEFENPTGALSNVGFTNSLASEVAIFPPPGSVASDHQDSQFLSLKGNNQPSRPAGFPIAVPDVSDWFGDPGADFPRHQLFYQKEIGKGWFGKVVEGEARGVKVVVRILREDATAEEKAFFLQEARIFRDLRHKNVCRLFGRCLEIDPYLLLFELHSNKDLKNFLLTNSSSRRAINEQGICLKLMTDVCEGLKFMNDNGFIHTDLAARNCLVTSDLTVKIGEYGTSIDLYKNEYYIAGDVAVPVRWCAPETLHCTLSTIETKQVTASANVWSAGVVLWEISEFGRLPYDDLSDDQVIVKVLGEERCKLPQPQCLFSDYLYKVMLHCWKSEDRASIDQILSMLHYLKSNPYQEAEFESRWRKLKPNTVPVVDNHTPVHSPRHTELAQRPRLSVKSDFDSGVDLEIKTSDETSKTSSIPTSPPLSVHSEDGIQSMAKSPSLTNLPGSMEDVSQLNSWLQKVDRKSEENTTLFSVGEYSSQASGESTKEAQKNRRIDFKLGPQTKSESSSDTEEETWRCRIERGEFSEKVKEKSKSVTDLMVLTHIDSEESENDSLPSLTKQYSLKRNSLKGNASTYYTSIGFGSEGNIRNAVLGEDLQKKLKSLSVKKVEPATMPISGENSPDSEASNQEHPFLAEAASDHATNENCATSEEGSNCVDCTSGMESPEPEAAFESDVLQRSSHEATINVPKIVITESELVNAEDDCDDVSQYYVDLKPRKFVLVCRDLDEEEEESSVILGSCEEHTLDFFKGLKTICSPTGHMTPETTEDEIEREENLSDEGQCNDLAGTTSNTSGGLVTSYSLPNISELRHCTDDLDVNGQPLEAVEGPASDGKSKQSSDCDMTPDELNGDISAVRSTSSEDSIDTYYLLDKGVNSFRDKQISELKNQLEDIMHCGDDYQTKTEDEYGGKLLTPDDERSSDSGFRDKGSLSESVEDTCDEKYNLEDIDAELDDFGLKPSERDLKMFDRSEGTLPIEGWFLQSHDSIKDNSGWTSLSTEDDFQEALTLDAEFVLAIRNELKEKLPCVQRQTEQTLDEECVSPVLPCDPAQFSYPSQLSPILEEQESNQSSLAVDDPRSSTDRDFDVSRRGMGTSELGDVEDDLLIVDTETNEITLVESPEITFAKEDMDEYHPSSSPDLTASLSTSSPEKCNLSGVYMSPSSVRSDLFDSGPPSLPFDLGQSLDEVEKSADDSLERVANILAKGFEVSMKSAPKSNDIETPEPRRSELDKFESSRGMSPETEDRDTPMIVVDDSLIKQKNAVLAIDKLLEIDSFERLSTAITNTEISETAPKEFESPAHLLPIHAAKQGNSPHALASPDLSSDDSKTHSLLSSHSSTPTYDDSKSQPPSTLALSSNSANVVSVSMPSPEDLDKSWRPTIGQLLEMADQAEGEEMTTSFIEPDENGRSPPCWESDTSDDHSSSSGDFIWKTREPSRMEIINEEDDSMNEDDDDCSSEGSGADFVPSSWDASAKPQKSSLKTGDSLAGKKKVIFKKEKYQCVYEYPKEPSDEEDNCDGWSSIHTAVDYSIFADWDLSEAETPNSASNELDSDGEDSKKKPDNHDFYRLNYSLGSQFMSDDGEFYISSSQALDHWHHSDSSSEFFPGRDSIGSVDENLFNPSAHDLTPLTLGGLRHTKDSLRLNLPSLNRQAAVADKAEAVILDSEADAPLVTSPMFFSSCIPSSSEA